MEIMKRHNNFLMNMIPYEGFPIIKTTTQTLKNQLLPKNCLNCPKITYIAYIIIYIGK